MCMIHGLTAQDNHLIGSAIQRNTIKHRNPIARNTEETWHMADNYLFIAKAISLLRLPFAMVQEHDRNKPRQRSDNGNSISQLVALGMKKKYKPVALKVWPVISELPEKFRIIQNIIGDPLRNLPALNPRPPPFVPMGRYMQERKEIFDRLNSGFLLPAECNLLHHFMTLHQDASAWDDLERGHFHEDSFPPVEIPVIPHTPLVLRNIPIPPGIYDDICTAIKGKLMLEFSSPQIRRIAPDGSALSRKMESCCKLYNLWTCWQLWRLDWPSKWLYALCKCTTVVATNNVGLTCFLTSTKKQGLTDRWGGRWGNGTRWSRRRSGSIRLYHGRRQQ